MTREQIRDLVKRYALACNAMLQEKENNALDLYTQLVALYSEGQAFIIQEVVRELLSSEELPEPVRSYWKGVQASRSIMAPEFMGIL